MLFALSSLSSKKSQAAWIVRHRTQKYLTHTGNIFLFHLFEALLASEKQTGHNFPHSAWSENIHWDHLSSALVLPKCISVAAHASSNKLPFNFTAQSVLL